MKKYIAFIFILFFGLFGTTFAEEEGRNGDTSWSFDARYINDSSLGLCSISRFSSSDPRHKKCQSLLITLAECKVAQCRQKKSSSPLFLLPKQQPSLPKQQPLSLSMHSLQDASKVSPLSNLMMNSLQPLKASLFGLVFKDCPADSSQTDLRNDYIAVRISNGLPTYSIATPGFVSQPMKVEGENSTWTMRVVVPRYENVEIPFYIYDRLGGVVQLSARTSACPS